MVHHEPFHGPRTGYQDLFEKTQENSALYYTAHM